MVIPFFVTTVDGGYWATNLLLAFALSVDALCASAIDATDEKVKNKRILFIFLTALVFSTFHFIMPVIGYFFGSLFVDGVREYTKWISFGILLTIGLKGIVEQLHDIHVDRMERLAKSVTFDGEGYIKKLVYEGRILKDIKKAYKALGEKLKKDEVHGIEELKYEDHKKCKALGIYLIHESRYLNKKRLEEIIDPALKEKRKGNNISSFLVTLSVQALATSLDALAVGFSYVGQVNADIAMYTFLMFYGVLFGICVGGGFLGKLLGEKYQVLANFLGSFVLIALAIKALF